MANLRRVRRERSWPGCGQSPVVNTRNERAPRIAAGPNFQRFCSLLPWRQDGTLRGACRSFFRARFQPLLELLLFDRLEPKHVPDQLPVCPKLSKRPARRGASFNRFNNLTAFVPGKSGQTALSATKMRPFAADSNFPADDASQPRTAMATALSTFVRAPGESRPCAALAV